MNIDTKKLAGFFADFRAIWVGVALLMVGATWAGDLRYMQKSDGEKIVVQVRLSNLQQRVEELEIQKAYETDAQKVKMIEALINIKKSKMDLLTK